MTPEQVDAFLRMKRQLADMRARMEALTGPIFDNPQPQQEHIMARPKKIYANAEPAGAFTDMEIKAGDPATENALNAALRGESPAVNIPDDLDALRQQAAAVDQAEAREVAEVNQLVGMVRASGFFSAVSRISMLKTLQTIKARKSYRGLVLCNIRGEIVTVSTWAGLCEALG